MDDTYFMEQAIRLSKLAVIHGNEPFGAVLVKDDKIAWESENRIYTGFDPTFHAEIGLIREYCAKTHIANLSEYTLYSSCEPCFMCCGAIVWSKVGRLVYAASDIDLCNILGKRGADCCKTVFDNSSWKPEVTAGVLRDKSIKILADYFSKNIKG